VGKDGIESYPVVQTVEKYRQYWRPSKEVKLLLLAESHRHTTDSDFQCRLDLSKINLPLYPSSYVQFVYCLAYGEGDLLAGKPESNPGTHDYWKIFYSCLNDINRHEDCSPIQKTRTKSLVRRINNKINLLQRMKEEGVWLVDASIIGIDNKHKPKNGIYEDVIEYSWNDYIGQIVARSSPAYVVIIGSMVRDVLESKVRRLVGDRLATIPQPAGFLSAEQRIDMLTECRKAFLVATGKEK